MKPSTSREPEKVKQPRTKWLELPSDVIANILSRVHVLDILENAQKVCTTWQKICKDPSMWRVICMDYLNFDDMSKEVAVWKHVVDGSQGQLIDITISEFDDDQIIQYVADRSSQLRRLKIINYSEDTYPYKNWTEILKKFPLLEELSLYSREISKEAIETAGRYCPMLKTFKLKGGALCRWLGDTHNEIAIAIGENLHKLENLELIGNSLTNIGLQVILDGCPHLKSLDLQHCWSLDLKGDLGKRCSEQIKCLKLPCYDVLYGDDLYDDDDYYQEYDKDLEYEGYID